MRNRMLPYQIKRILNGRHEALCRQILGVDVSGRHILPILKGVYYVDVHDPVGLEMVRKNTPAFCEYASGDIFCLYDERVPVTEARLVHEFLHRAARRRRFFRFVSGVDTHRRFTRLNEVITEYLAMRIIGGDYYEQVHPNNGYLEFFGEMAELEDKIGIGNLTRAYLDGRRKVFKDVSAT